MKIDATDAPCAPNEEPCDAPEPCDPGAGRDAHASEEPGSPDDAALALRFLPRVEAIARRFERRYALGSASRDDLVSAGQWGLLQALRRRRLDAHPRELAAYLNRRIEGAVFDEVRRMLGRRRWNVVCAPDDLEPRRSDAQEVTASFGPQGAMDPERTLEGARRWRQVCQSLGEAGTESQRLLLDYATGRSMAELARRAGGSSGRMQAQLARGARQIRARAPELRRLLREELD